MVDSIHRVAGEGEFVAVQRRAVGVEDNRVAFIVDGAVGFTTPAAPDLGGPAQSSVIRRVRGFTDPTVQLVLQRTVFLLQRSQSADRLAQAQLAQTVQGFHLGDER